MNRCLRPLTAALLGLLLTATFDPIQGGVVINEVLYHPPGDDDSLQFIELHNLGTEPVSLTGWKLSRGVSFTAPPSTIGPGGFAVICRQRATWERAFGTNLTVLGEFKGRLKHGGEHLELTDAQGQVIDAVRYDDTSPWPSGPDGNGSSLERITPSAASNDPHNWAAATTGGITRLAATPGRTNSVFSARLPPVISNVRFTSPTPGVPTRVTASVSPTGSGHIMELRFQSIAVQLPKEETVVPMKPSDTNGSYSADLPAQPNGRLVRFRIRAVDSAGAQRFEPAPGEPRPTFSAFLQKNTNTLTVPEVRLLEFGPRESPGPSLHHRARRSDPPVLRGQSTLLYFPTNGGPVGVFDHIRLTPRSGGWKVRLHKEDPLEGMTTLNIVYEQQPRWVLAEPLAYEVFRRAGVPTPKTAHVRLWQQGKPVGYHLLVEQANSAFLRQHQMDPDGDLFKLLWYGNGVVRQHEKKNNRESGHTNLLSVIDGLNRLGGEAQWSFIESHFEVQELINYFAASLCVENWDGFFNNYFAYRAPGPRGKWSMLPWDLDKTWGDYDGASPAYDWYELPITYGMKGDREPGGRSSLFQTQWGSSGWWRPGGYFSAPILANPQFRKRFLIRLKNLCQSVFTEREFLPAINDLERRLEPEVRFRAGLEGEDPAQAITAFRESIQSFRRQLRHRNAFLMKELSRLPADQ